MAFNKNDEEKWSSQNNLCGTKNDEAFSNEFPNFAALTGVERLAFFEALSAARKNVERRGTVARRGYGNRRCRRRLGTVHDEYLRRFEESHRPESSSGERENTCPRDTPRRGAESASTVTVSDPRVVAEEASAATGVPRGRYPAADARVLSVYETVLEEDSNKIVNLYLKKKKMELGGRETREIHRTTSKNGGAREVAEKRGSGSEDALMGSTSTPRFDALSSEEKAVFFRTLRKARDSVHQKNPQRDILPFETILRRYDLARGTVAVHHATTADDETVKRRARKEHRNLKVKVLLTCADNERLKRRETDRDRKPRNEGNSGEKTTSKDTFSEREFFKKNEKQKPRVEELKASPTRKLTDRENAKTTKSGTKNEATDDEIENVMTQVEVVKKGRKEKRKKKENNKKRSEEEQEKVWNENDDDDHKKLGSSPSAAREIPEQEKSLKTPDDGVKAPKRVEDEGKKKEETTESARFIGADEKPEVGEPDDGRRGENIGAEASPEARPIATAGSKDDLDEKLEEERRKNEKAKEEEPVEMGTPGNRGNDSSNGAVTEGVSIVSRGRFESVVTSSDENVDCGETSERGEPLEPDRKRSPARSSVEKEPAESRNEEKRSSPSGLLARMDAGAKSCCRVAVVARSLPETRLPEKFRPVEDRRAPHGAAEVRQSLTSPQVFADSGENTKSKPEMPLVASYRDELPKKEISEPESFRAEKDSEGASGTKASSTALSSTGTGSDALNGEKGDANGVKGESKEGREKTEKYEEDEENEDNEEDSLLVPMFVKKKALPTTKIRILQDLLKERAAFVEGSIGDFKIVPLPPREGGITETPTARLRVDEDEETRSEKGIKSRFVKVLANLCRCGKKDVVEEDNILENLKGEAVAVDVSKGTRTPASVTLNESTVEVLKAAQRKKIIQKYWKTT